LAVAGNGLHMALFISDMCFPVASVSELQDTAMGLAAADGVQSRWTGGAGHGTTEFRRRGGKVVRTCTLVASYVIYYCARSVRDALAGVLRGVGLTVVQSAVVADSLCD
jgi:hypothetical protein